MAYPESSIIFWALGLAQIIGLASAWLARLSEGSPKQVACQWLFVTCLGLLGLLTVLAVLLGPHYVLACGTTLSVMILAAICDFRAHARVHRL